VELKEHLRGIKNNEFIALLEKMMKMDGINK